MRPDLTKLTFINYDFFDNQLVNCVWGSWTSWSTCSITCGTGTKTRTRIISTHEANGGTACSGDSSEISQVNCGTCAAGTFIFPEFKLYSTLFLENQFTDSHFLKTSDS